MVEYKLSKILYCVKIYKTYNNNDHLFRRDQVNVNDPHISNFGFDWSLLADCIVLGCVVSCSVMSACVTMYYCVLCCVVSYCIIFS